ncbi:small GTPase [Eremomyces bilateralis CBS 781.70]|uniref:Small GTPase n=1 Tax=Eremomyces bilateralis CBS 781.70 TaxID=1392243 RepID=A0A6G1GD57_9PEZI|nr:small GTPase [Eremomyces bilateralis CBS 781.70]KAF1815799.1 small GTPase [Eremomyces bilateralis CBS 781.70]
MDMDLDSAQGAPPLTEPQHSTSPTTSPHDQTMDMDDTMQTITASSMQQAAAAAAGQEFQTDYSNGNSHDPRPQTSYSDTAYRPYDAHSQYNTSENDTPPRPGYHSQHSYSRGGSRPSSLAGSGNHSPYDMANRQAGYQEQQMRAQQPESAAKNTSVVIKVGMVGDAQIGKTSLMVKYVEGSWDEDYIQTLGVNFMEKTISIRNTEITFSIWDLGGQREFVNMLPLVCNDAVAILFMFDLTRKSTLNSIKEWYRQGRGFNKTAIPFLVGTKYDHFVNFPREEQEEISNQAKRFAKAMKAPLIFSSTSHSINVQKIFKIVLSKAFDLRCTIPEIENVGEPLLLYQSVG